MSRVMEPAAPAGQQGQPPQQPEKAPEPWILDDNERPKRSWIMDPTPMESSEQPPAPPAAAQPAPQPTPGQIQHVQGAEPGQGFQYVLPTGHVLRAPTQEALVQQLGQLVNGLAQHVTTQQRDYNRPQEPQPQPQPTIQRQPFDGKRFYALLAEEKPIEAMHSLLQEYFGVEDPRRIAQNADYAYSHAEKMNDRLETADFLSNNPDFPASDQSADVLLKRLERDAVPLTRWNLEVAFQQLVRENVLQRIQVAQPQAPAQPQDYRTNYQQPPEQPQPSRGAGAPPVPGNSGGGTAGDRDLSDFEFEQLSTPEQKAYLQKRGLI